MAGCVRMARGADTKGGRIEVAADVASAWTLPGTFYGDAALHARVRERVFARSWQFLGEAGRVEGVGDLLPLTLLDGCLDEPVVLARESGDRLHCLSNVCTHRGNVLVEAPGRESRGFRCRYHGRRFGLDGRFQSMPEFERVAAFPSAADDLPRLPLERWSRFLFTSVDPSVPFSTWIEPVVRRVGWIDLGAVEHDATRSREYTVQASWALYCDNYLEGFHVPFVHPGLAGAIDYGTYRTELFEHSSLQIAVANQGEDAFEPPAGTPEHGQRIAAYYFWLFPNTMLNFYPWGLSVNVVAPQGPERTRVSFLAYVGDRTRLGKGAGAELDKVEREDEQVVESVQRGVRSRLYGRGRFSPTRETGVHHFHRLLARSLDG